MRREKILLVLGLFCVLLWGTAAQDELPWPSLAKNAARGAP